MDEQEIEMVGEYVEQLFRHQIFGLLCQNFESEQIEKIQNTSPKQQDIREEAYHTQRGAREFLDYMLSFVSRKDSIKKSREDHAALAIEAGIAPDAPTDHDVLLGDDLRFTE